MWMYALLKVCLFISCLFCGQRASLFFLYPIRIFFLHKPDRTSGSKLTIYFGIAALKTLPAHVTRIFGTYIAGFYIRMVSAFSHLSNFLVTVCTYVFRGYTPLFHSANSPAMQGTSGQVSFHRGAHPLNRYACTLPSLHFFKELIGCR
jgi:hypothetical protein